MKSWCESCAIFGRRLSPVFDDWIAPIWQQLVLSRVPLMIVLAALVLTAYVPQIQELFFLLCTNTEHSGWNRFFAVICTLYLAFSVWYSARFLFYFNYPSRSVVYGNKISQWWPRIFGALVPLLLAIGCFLYGNPRTDNNAGVESWSFTGVFIAEAALVFVASWKRPVLVRMYNNAVRRAISKEPSRGQILWNDQRFEDCYEQLCDASSLGRSFLLSGPVLGLALFLAAVSMREVFVPIGAIATIELGAATFTLLSTFLVYLGDRHCVPIFGLFAILLIAMRSFNPATNHVVTVVAPPHDGVSPSAVAPTLTKSDFIDRARAAADSDPVFLVSTEGGGIRAAAWTALVLSEIEQAAGPHVFHEALLAASGVSGGSVGLAVFSATAAQKDIAATAFACQHAAGGTQRIPHDCVAAAFSTLDYLGSVLPAMLFADPLQFAIPLASPFGDRGKALEEAWEAGLLAAVNDHIPGGKLGPTDSPLRRPWRSLSDKSKALPVLFLNSTEVDTGRRFIQQPLDFGNEFDQWFHGATNGADWLDDNTPLSAVAHNSARFTYISPPGTVTGGIHGKHRGHQLQLVDGGYYEDSGTETLAEIYLGLIASKVNAERIYVIHISNSPDVASILTPDSAGQFDNCPSTNGNLEPTHMRGEVETPPFALLDTMEGRAVAARERLRDIVTKRTDAFHFFHFRLCEGVHHFPLGWTLSNSAWDEMLTQIGDVNVGNEQSVRNFNRKQIDRIAGLMRHPPSASKAAESLQGLSSSKFGGALALPTSAYDPMALLVFNFSSRSIDARLSMLADTPDPSTPPRPLRKKSAPSPTSGGRNHVPKKQLPACASSSSRNS